MSNRIGVMLSSELVPGHSTLAVDIAQLCESRGLDTTTVQSLIDDAPPSWWGQGDARVLAGDLALLGPGIGAEGVRNRITAGTGATWQLAIVTVDRIGAFATTCATVVEYGLSILEARAASWTAHGLALQHLTVVPVEKLLSGEPDWPTIGLGLRAALVKPILTVEGANTLPDGCVISSITQPVGASNGSGIWTVEITGPDTVGLLAEVTRTLTALGVDILSAEVTSNSGVALDTFTVRLTDPAGISALKALAV